MSVIVSGLWPHAQLRSVAVVITTLAMLTLGRAQRICPLQSTNCTVGRYDQNYIYHMTCSQFGVQAALPDACQYSLMVTELLIEPDTSRIRTIPARALDGLRVRKLVLGRLGIEMVSVAAFTWLADDLQELFLDGNLITSLPNGVFSPLSNLKRLQLQNNRLTTVGSRFLGGLASLVVLDLSGNQISAVDLNAWTPVPVLSTLRLHDNAISGILNSARLQDLAELQELRLDGNRFSEVTDDAFRLLPKLRSVNIARNGVRALPGSVFSANSVLEEVDASHNEIGGLESAVFNETTRLTTLMLHDNRIDTLPIYVFKHMNNLRVLRLERNVIADVPSNSLSGLSSLRRLDLSHNRLTSLPLGIFDPLGLVDTMSLAGNQISVVAQRPFASMRNLLTLDLSNNRLSSMGDWFQTTTGLTHLHLDGNRLNDIHPEALSSLSGLQELHLARNLLSSVAGGLFRNSASLNYLDMSSNPLRRVRDDNGTTFGGLTSLRRMNLSSTCLEELSIGGDSVAVPAMLPALEELDVSANTLRNLSASMFAGVRALQQLRLFANDIDQLDVSAFSTLTNLQHLDLSSNALRSGDQLWAALSTLPPLTAVDLSWNLLTSVDGLPPLSAGVYLAGNPLRCDCNSSSWLATDFTRLLDSERTACLNAQTGGPEVLTCHWTACHGEMTTPSTGALTGNSDCSAPEDSMSYLRVPVRRSAVVCPWDESPPSVHSVSVDILSATSIRVSWNLTSTSEVSVRLLSNAGNTSGETYEFSANVTECSIGNLTSGERYEVCVTTSGGGDSACVAVVFPVQPATTTTRSPVSSLQLRISAASTTSELRMSWNATSTSGRVDIVHFRLTWLENGISTDDVATALVDRSNRSYTITDLRVSTVYFVCVQALAETRQMLATECGYFATEAGASDDNTLLIIIVAASAVALLILLLVILVICCCCCCRRHPEQDNAATKPDVILRPTWSTRSVSRRNLAEHSIVSVSVYEEQP